MSRRDNSFIPPKRKLDDQDELFLTNFDDFVISSHVNKMGKLNQADYCVASSSSSSSTTTTVNELSQVVTCDTTGLQNSVATTELQFFVKMISEGKSIVMHAKRGDTVEMLHEQVFAITGIPKIKQRFLYQGKQLKYEQTLEDCGIENDVGLQLVGRMRSTKYPKAWKAVGEVILLIMQLCKGELVLRKMLIHNHLFVYLSRIPFHDSVSTKEYLDILLTASVPAALTRLYVSHNGGNKNLAITCIQLLLNTYQYKVPKHLSYLCVPVVLELCNSLRSLKDKSSMYKDCRHALGVLLNNMVMRIGVESSTVTNNVVEMSVVFSFINELKSDLCKDLTSTLKSPTFSKPSAEDVRDFRAFLHPMKSMIKEKIGDWIPIKIEFTRYPPFFVKEIVDLIFVYNEMMKKIDICLMDMDSIIAAKGIKEALQMYRGWSQYLDIIKELYGISKLYQGAEMGFWNVLRKRKEAVRPLVLRYAMRTNDHFWLLGHNDVLDFESRRHLIMMMFHEVGENYAHEMLIDRSKLLAESFAYIAHAEPETLHAGLFMEFNNEEATGPGVLREWFLLVSQALFNKQNVLFVACEGDPRQFYPNTASKVDPLHLQYFTFSGRVIALALMHNVQIGVLFARCFYLQLAGKFVSLEDIKDVDPTFYSSCNKILEMDAETVDSDALGLTFVDEVQELGLRKVVELCPGGKSIVVNSVNRSKYINLLIHHRFVNSIREQVARFSKGFNDILRHERFGHALFNALDLEDFNVMLCGAEDDICVEDWKTHTEYYGYKETDAHIVWFWKIVDEMTMDQRKNLLFFWTSMKNLPYNGFGGLSSQLQISRYLGTCDRLPKSHTCFYRLEIPAYPTLDEMRARLNIIIQEHVGSSFGNW